MIESVYEYSDASCNNEIAAVYSALESGAVCERNHTHISSHHIPPISYHHYPLLLTLSTQTCDSTVPCLESPTNSSVAAASIKCLSSLPAQPANTIRLGVYFNENCDFCMYLLSPSLTLPHSLPSSFLPYLMDFQLNKMVVSSLRLSSGRQDVSMVPTTHVMVCTCLVFVFRFLFLSVFLLLSVFLSTSSNTSYQEVHTAPILALTPSAIITARPILTIPLVVLASMSPFSSLSFSLSLSSPSPLVPSRLPLPFIFLTSHLGARACLVSQLK